MRLDYFPKDPDQTPKTVTLSYKHLSHLTTATEQLYKEFRVRRLYDAASAANRLLRDLKRSHRKYARNPKARIPFDIYPRDWQMISVALRPEQQPVPGSQAMQWRYVYQTLRRQGLGRARQGAIITGQTHTIAPKIGPEDIEKITDIIMGYWT